MRGQSVADLSGYVGILLLFNALLIPGGLLAFRAARGTSSKPIVSHY